MHFEVKAKCYHVSIGPIINKHLYLCVGMANLSKSFNYHDINNEVKLEKLGRKLWEKIELFYIFHWKR